MKRAVVAVVVAAVALVAVAAPASAHASLRETEPAAGDIVDAAPREIVLRFTESVDVEDDGVRVFDAQGDEVTAGDVVEDGSTIALPVPALDAGGFVVTWRAVSLDGHPIGGGFTFRVGADAPAVDPELVARLIERRTTGDEVGIAFGVVRFAVFGALLLLVGGAFFLAALWPGGADRRSVRRLLWWAWAVLLGGTLAGIGLQGADVKGLGLLDAFDPSVNTDVLATDVGKVWALRAFALVPVAWLLAKIGDTAKTWWRVDAAVFGLVLVATPAFSGHANAGRWRLAAKLLDVPHVAAAALWLGGLAVLLVALRNRVPEARSITERFSTPAFVAVIVVVLTGVGQSIRQVSSLDQLETSFGRLLAVKVVIVLALIGIASLTRSALQGRLVLGDEDEDAGAAPQDEIGVLRKLVVAEVAVALAIVAVTSLLVDANPGYAAESVAGPFDETRVVDDVLVNVVAVPGTVGPTDLHVYVDNPAGGLTPPVGATGTLAREGGDGAGIDLRFVTAGPSHWSANDVDIPTAGDWVLTLDVQLTDVDRITATFTIPIGGSQ